MSQITHYTSHCVTSIHVDSYCWGMLLKMLHLFNLFTCGTFHNITTFIIKLVWNAGIKFRMTSVTSNSKISLVLNPTIFTLNHAPSALCSLILHCLWYNFRPCVLHMFFWVFAGSEGDLCLGRGGVMACREPPVSLFPVYLLLSQFISLMRDTWKLTGCGQTRQTEKTGTPPAVALCTPTEQDLQGVVGGCFGF